MQPDEELVDWTREALSHLYDRAFLEQHVAAECVRGLFADSLGLQQALTTAIQELKPPADISTNASAWRIFEVLSLRYLEGLTQPEAADELNVSLRHFKREQQHAVQEVATALFEKQARQGPAQPQNEKAAPRGVLRNVAQPPGAAEGRLVHLDDVIRAALNVLSAVLQQQDLAVNVRIETQLPGVAIDPAVCRQLVISGLAWLVRKASGQTFDISLRERDGYVVLTLPRPRSQAEVVHSGEESLSAVFNVLGQLDHSARIRFAVQSIDKSDVLELAFPASRTHCILMIDDNPDVIRLAQQCLGESDEFVIAGATKADEALKQIADLRPSCILLDLLMPQRDGWDVLNQLKANPGTAAIPIVISSVLEEQGLALAMGAAGILPRPFDAQQLTDTLRSAIARSATRPAA
jgi:CheY-like chemotaxis protein/predicted DNA-binding protein (UPF0251 family)